MSSRAVSVHSSQAVFTMSHRERMCSSSLTARRKPVRGKDVAQSLPHYSTVCILRMVTGRLLRVSRAAAKPRIQDQLPFDTDRGTPGPTGAPIRLRWNPQVSHSAKALRGPLSPRGRKAKRARGGVRRARQASASFRAGWLRRCGPLLTLSHAGSHDSYSPIADRRLPADAVARPWAAAYALSPWCLPLRANLLGVRGAGAHNSRPVPRCASRCAPSFTVSSLCSWRCGSCSTNRSSACPPPFHHSRLSTPETRNQHDGVVWFYPSVSPRHAYLSVP